MKITKDNVLPEDKKQALDILNKLRAGDRVFGSPAESLRKTLAKLEKNAPKKDSVDDISYNLDDRDYEGEIAKLKKGIKGEETLSQYFEKVIRLDPVLSDIIIFASLGDVDTSKDYIPDTDFLAIYGNHLLAIDAKSINTNPEIPLFVQDEGIYSGMDHNAPLLEVNSQVPVWKKIMASEYKGEVGSIRGCVCIINKSGACIFRDEEWLHSDIKPLHINELVDFLHSWVKDKDPTFDLGMLVKIMNKQVKKNESTIDLSYGKRLLGI